MPDRLPTDGTVTDDVFVEEALRSIPELSVITFDPELRIRSLHGGALERHGYVPARMLGQRLEDVLPRAAYEEFLPLYRRALRGETLSIEWLARDRTALYEVVMQPLDRDGTRIGGIVTLRDITARRAAERAERRAAAYLAATFTDGPVPMLLLRAGRIERANRAMAELVGVDAPSLAGRDPLDWVHPDDRERATASIGRTASGAVPDPQDRRILAADGSARHMRLRYSLVEIQGDEGPLAVVHFVDRTAQVEANRARENALVLFETSFREAPVGKALLGLDGRFLRVNPALCRLLGRSEADLLATDDLDAMVHQDDRADGARKRSQAMTGALDTYVVDKRYLRPDGTTIEARLSASLIRDADGAPLRLVAQLVDLTELNDALRRVERLASHDALTGLFNRRRFDDELAREAARAARSGAPSSLLLIDLDGFKLVNDTAGHAAGDELLRAIGRALTGQVRATDVVARLGGDEFGVLAPGTSAEAARTLAAKLQHEVARAARALGTGVTASIGVSAIGPGGDPAEALAAADREMYRAKAATRPARP